MDNLPNPREAAWNFIIRNGINSLPPDPKKVLAAEGTELISYNDLSYITNKSIGALAARYGAESFAFISGDGRKVIAVNGAYGPEERRFFAFREMGHFVFGHINVNRKILEPGQKYYKAFRAESSDFSRRILCPSIVLHSLKAYLAPDIIRICKVGPELADTVERHIPLLLKRGKFLESETERKVFEQFGNFINKAGRETEPDESKAQEMDRGRA